MNTLRIYLLGQFKVLVNDKLVTEFATGAVRALLAYLALKPAQHHEREHLAQLLWGDESREKGLTNLRTTLSRLRTAISDENEESSIIQITRQAIWLNPNIELWVDLHVVHKLVASIQNHKHYAVERCPLCAEKIRQIIDLYGGELFTGLNLNSIDFDYWQRTQQELLHDALLKMLKVLADFHLYRNEFIESIRYARQQLAIDDWDEQAYQQLMQGLYANGQRGAAMAQYKRCCAILQTEFDALPNVITQALYEKIRLDKDYRSRPLLGVHTLSQTTKLYGRQYETKWLLERLVSPEYQIVTVTGISGIGKTRLAIELAHALRGCFRDGVWFVPLVELLPSNSPEITSEAIASKIADVLELPQNAAVSRRQQLMASISRKSMLLILDNFELLTTGTTILRELVKASQELTLLITSRTRLELEEQVNYSLNGLSCRDTDRQPSSHENDAALRFFIESAQRVDPDFTIIENSQEHEEFVQFCKTVCGLPLALELTATRVNRQSIAKLTQQISARSHTYQQSKPDEAYGYSILDSVFDTTWQLLDSAAQHLFQKLTVFSGAIELSAAQQVADATNDLLDTLVRHHFITFDAVQDRFHIHPLLHQYGWNQLQKDRELARKIRNRHAAHYCQWLNSMQIYLKNADTRTTLNLMSLDLGNLHRAWQWASLQQNIHWLDEAIESFNIFFLRQNRYQEGVQICAEALSELTQINELDGLTLRAMLLVWKGRFLQILGKDADADQQNKEAMLLVESAVLTDDPQENKRLSVLAAVFAQRGHLTAEGNPKEAAIYFNRALDLYRTCKDRWDEANMLAALGRCAQMTGNYEDAERYDRDALLLRSEMGDPATIAVSWLDLGIVAMEQKRFENAEQLFLQAAQMCQTADDAYGHARSIGMLGLLYRQTDRKQEAIQTLLSCVAELEQLQRPVEQCEFLLKIASLYIELGQTSQAMTRLQQALKLANTAQIQPLVTQTETLLGSLLSTQIPEVPSTQS